MEKLKMYLTKVLEFTTGLGFYGLGLLLAGVIVWTLFGFDHIGAGLVGAFVYKNYKAIVEYAKSLIKNKGV